MLEGAWSLCISFQNYNIQEGSLAWPDRYFFVGAGKMPPQKRKNSGLATRDYQEGTGKVIHKPSIFDEE